MDLACGARYTFQLNSDTGGRVFLNGTEISPSGSSGVFGQFQLLICCVLTDFKTFTLFCYLPSLLLSFLDVTSHFSLLRFDRLVSAVSSRHATLF